MGIVFYVYVFVRYAFDTLGTSASVFNSASVPFLMKKPSPELDPYTLPEFSTRIPRRPPPPMVGVERSQGVQAFTEGDAESQKLHPFYYDVHMGDKQAENALYFQNEQDSRECARIECFDACFNSEDGPVCAAFLNIHLECFYGDVDTEE